MAVIHVSNTADWRRHLGSAGAKTVVVDFSASWCGPCREIAPVFEELAGAYVGSVFLKVDVDEADEVAEEYGVNAMPTFLFIQSGNVVHKVQGADEGALRSAVARFASKEPPFFTGGGMKLGSDAPQAAQARASGGVAADSGVAASEALVQLLEMGFDESLAQKAIDECGANVEAAVQYIANLSTSGAAAPDASQSSAPSEQGANVRPGREEQVAKLEERLTQAREARERDEREREKQRELNRIEQGKIAAQEKREREEKMRQIDADARTREKRETARERKRLRELLKQDKLEREERNKMMSGSEQSIDANKPENLTTAPVGDANSSCKIAVRMQNGKTVTNEFDPSTTIRDIVDFVTERRGPQRAHEPFSLMTNFPRRVYTDDLLDRTIADEQLQNGVLIVTRKH